MPGAHRHTDSRFCGATTIVLLQTNVYVNGLLWAVEGDIDTHCNEGALIQVVPKGNVYINGKKVITAVGDKAEPDNSCATPHPGPPTDPLGHSSDTYAYGGSTGSSGGGGSAAGTVT
jgi:hypothetical protein